MKCEFRPIRVFVFSSLLACNAACSTVEAPTGTSDASSDGSKTTDDDAGTQTPPEADGFEVGLSTTFFPRYFGPMVEGARAGDLTLDWSEGAPLEGVGKDRWALRLEGQIEAKTAGTYQFRVSGDDGIRLWFGERMLINDWVDGGSDGEWTSYELAAGWHDIRVEYYEVTGPAKLVVEWRTPDGTEGIVPAASTRSHRVAVRDPVSPAPHYTNPVTGSGCPDPGVLKVGDWFYVACTGGRMRIRRSRDLVHWESTNVDIAPGGKAPWSLTGKRNWAPELHKVGDKIVAYFTAENSAGKLSIGAAVADSIKGPFKHQNGPMVNHSQGVIDATFFEDDNGKRYLIYKIDGNSVGAPTPNYIRELNANGLSFKSGSSQKEVLRNSLGWENGIVEALWVHKRAGKYYLFYSGNNYNYRYRTGVARADSIMGPYSKKGNPILSNNAFFVGPGHGSIVTENGLDYFVYHAWFNNGSGGNDTSRGRRIMVDRIDWKSGWPVIEHDATPSVSPRPRPGHHEVCQVGETTGACMDTSKCDGTSTPGHCTGPTQVQCCTM